MIHALDTTYQKESACHEGTTYVFTDPISKLKFYGGGDYRGLIIYKGHLILDVGANISSEVLYDNLSADTKELQKYNTTPVIRLRWFDYSVPSLPFAFWTDLLDVIRAEKRDVICACMGGHGRTGTILSILGAITEGIPPNICPVSFIREHYCKNAVESLSQILYIEKMTNRTVLATPADEVTWLGY